MEGCRVLHAGQGFSSVVLCADATGEPVVVKTYATHVMAPRHTVNLRREVAILSDLAARRVPGVVRLLAARAGPGGGVALAFAPCAGGTLLDALRAAPWPERRVRDCVARPLLATLARLHALGVMHRDVKPENVFLEADGSATLGDFGLAIRPARGERAISRVGTPGFMAPEVLAQPGPREAAALGRDGVPTYGERADVYSYGALVYEALAGSVPYANDAAPVAAAKARFCAPPPLPEAARASAAAADFVRRALEPDPRLRPSAAELLRHPWLAADEGGEHVGIATTATAAGAGAESTQQHGRLAHERPAPQPQAQQPHATATAAPARPPAADAAGATQAAVTAGGSNAPAAAAAAQRPRAVFDSFDSFAGPARRSAAHKQGARACAGWAARLLGACLCARADAF